MTKPRLVLATLAILVFALPAGAQTPDAATPNRPAAQATPGADGAQVPCGERIERLIASVLSQFGDARPSSQVQRRSLDAFKSAAERARALVRSACADERSAASIKELEAAEKQLRAALESLQPALQNLYGSLSDEQKEQLGAISRDLQGWITDLWRDFAQNFDLRSDPGQPGGRDRFRFCVEGTCFSMPRDVPSHRREERSRNRDEYRL